MIKDFFIKKETIFILLIAIISIFFIVLGFLFLFFKSNNESTPRTIPITADSIVWDTFSSKVLNQKIKYPEYMFIEDIKDDFEGSLMLSEFKPSRSLNLFSNQNHIAFYPNGSAQQFFYGKVKNSEFISETGQKYTITEYLTFTNDVWAVSFKPINTPSSWHSQGFIWVHTQIQNRELLCISNTGLIIRDVECDPYQGQKIIYDGKITGNFSKIAYEIINKNKFE
jgi:hypothetical protein